MVVDVAGDAGVVGAEDDELGEGLVSGTDGSGVVLECGLGFVARLMGSM